MITMVPVRSACARRLATAMAWPTHAMPSIKDLYAGCFPGCLAWSHAHPQPGYVPALIPPGVDLAGLGVQP